MEEDMTVKKFLLLVGIVLLLLPGTGFADPPTAPAPRPVTLTIQNLRWTYRDMRTASAADFESWVRDLPADALPVVLSALKTQRAEIEKKEAILRERLKAKDRTADKSKQE